jgi:hypothetical protein
MGFHMAENDRNVVIASEPRIECIRFLAWATDDLLCGTLLSYILNWEAHHSNEFLTESDKNLKNILCMNRIQFDSTKRLCKRLNYITTTLKGFPAKTEYKVNFNHLQQKYKEYIESDIIIQRTKMLKNLRFTLEITPDSESKTQFVKYNELENQANTPVGDIPVTDKLTNCEISPKTQFVKYNELENQAENGDLPPISAKSATKNLPATIDSYNINNPNKEDNNITTVNVNDKVKGSKKKMNKNGRMITKNSVEYELAALLFEMIHKRRPNFHGEAGTVGKQKHLKIISWAGHIRLMIEKDKRAIDDIYEVIEWCQKNYFWKDNVLSTRKLRSQFGQLQIRIEEEVKQNQIPFDPNPKITEKFITNFEKVFLNGRKPAWTNNDVSKFVTAAAKAATLAGETNLPVEEIPQFIIEALKCYKNNNCCMVHVGHLCAANTWDVLLPQYLKDVGVTMKNT